MRKQMTIPILLLLGFSLACAKGQGLVQPDPNDPNLKYDWIDVVVVDAFTLKPIPNARVWLWNSEASPRAYRLSPTDGNGVVRVYLTAAPEGERPLWPCRDETKGEPLERYDMDRSWGVNQDLASGVIIDAPGYFRHGASVLALAVTPKEPRTWENTLGNANDRRLWDLVWNRWFQNPGKPTCQAPHPLMDPETRAPVHARGYAYLVPRDVLDQDRFLQYYLGCGSGYPHTNCPGPSGFLDMLDYTSLSPIWLPDWDPRSDVTVWIQAPSGDLKNRMKRAVLDLLSDTDMALGYFKHLSVRLHPMAMNEARGVPIDDPSFLPPGEDKEGVVLVYHNHRFSANWHPGQNEDPLEEFLTPIPGFCGRLKWRVIPIWTEDVQEVWGRDYDDRYIQAEAASWIGLGEMNYFPLSFPANRWDRSHLPSLRRAIRLLLWRVGGLGLSGNTHGFGENEQATGQLFINCLIQ